MMKKLLPFWMKWDCWILWTKPIFLVFSLNQKDWKIWLVVHVWRHHLLINTILPFYHSKVPSFYHAGAAAHETCYWKRFFGKWDLSVANYYLGCLLQIKTKNWQILTISGFFAFLVGTLISGQPGYSTIVIPYFESSKSLMFYLICTLMFVSYCL